MTLGIEARKTNRTVTTGEAICIFSELKKRLGDGKEWRNLALDDYAEDFLNPVKKSIVEIVEDYFENWRHRQ